MITHINEYSLVPHMLDASGDLLDIHDEGGGGEGKGRRVITENPYNRLERSYGWKNPILDPSRSKIGILPNPRATFKSESHETPLNHI